MTFIELIPIIILSFTFIEKVLVDISSSLLLEH